MLERREVRVLVRGNILVFCFYGWFVLCERVGGRIFLVVFGCFYSFYFVECINWFYYCIYILCVIIILKIKKNF